MAARGGSRLHARDLKRDDPSLAPFPQQGKEPADRPDEPRPAFRRPIHAFGEAQAADRIRDEAGQELRGGLATVSFLDGQVFALGSGDPRQGVELDGILRGETLRRLGGITSLIEPLIIDFLGVVVGGIVICMFLPIFKISTIIN